MEHESVRYVRSFYAAFQTEDHEDQVHALLHPLVTWHVAGANPLAGDFVGVEAVLRAMRRFGEHSNHTLKLDTRLLFGDADHVIAVHLATAYRPGLDYSAHEIDVFHIAAGLIIEFWSFSEDQPATDALWSIARPAV